MSTLSYDKAISEVFAQVQSSEQGLTSSQAQARLLEYGKNAIHEAERQSAIGVFLEQFKGIPTVLLTLATIASIMLGQYAEAAAIAGILIINAIIGYIQERKASDAIAALKRLTALKVKVLRSGAKELVDADQLVPGDIIFLETGDKVPADARIIESHNASALESALTGESTPVSKTATQLSGKLSLGDQKNMVFSGTVITAGRLTAVVAATAMQTELGKVATMLSSVDEHDSPLKQKVDRMVQHLSIIILCMAVAVFIILYFVRPDPTNRLFTALFTAIAMAIAALPEGLPIILTITSAIGIKRMVKRHVLIRRLMSVETLGSVTVICTDKTGTLTKNQMTVEHIYVNGAAYAVHGSGYEFTGDIAAPPSAELTYLLLCGALCNDASITGEKHLGDPTELALIVSAAKGGVSKQLTEKDHPRLEEKEFTSERKLMSTVHEFDGKRVQFVKGAPDILIHQCIRILEHGKVRTLSQLDRSTILAQVSGFSQQALRVLAFAYRDVHGSIEEADLTFIGLQAMIDPPREEVKESIARCTDAGIKVIMITGDHPETAAAIGRELGITGKLLIGAQLDTVTDMEAVVREIGIYARVNPEHKLRIVSALQAQGHIVAMTGDGVNDAPALKKADMGIAMGITGTDVAKEASQMIITDDNFSSIVNAVEEGRSIYDNIKRFVRYQLSTNIGAMIVLITTMVLLLPLPLLPLQLLWINLSIDGPPALSLGLEPANKRVLKRKPRPRNEPLITPTLLLHVLIGAAIMAAGTLFVFLHYCSSAACAVGTYPYRYATTMAFTTFACFQFFNVLNCRSLTQSVFSIGFFANRMAIVTILITATLHAALLYIPFLQEVFGTVALDLHDWLLAVGVASSILILYEIKKFFFPVPVD